MLYLIESTLCLSLFYGFYILVLRRETFFQLNRAYLLIAPLISLLVPLLNIPLSKKTVPVAATKGGETALPAVENWPVVFVEQMQEGPKAVREVLSGPVFQLTLETVLWWVYLIGASLLIIRLGMQLWSLRRFLKSCKRQKKDGVTLLEGGENTPVASFLGFVFWQNKDSHSPEAKLLLEHEYVHVREWHTLDIILMELLVAFQWFNPLLYLYKKSIREVHEYIADDHVVRRTRQRYEYASLLVRHQQSGKRAQPGLVNTFHSLIKNRLIMLAKRPSGSLNRLKYLLALPLFAGMLLLFSFRLVEHLPTVAPLLEQVELYEDQLSEVVIAGDAQVASDNKYIFYWGSVEVRFPDEPKGKKYIAKLPVSHEEFLKSIEREPRLWNGETLLEKLQFRIPELDMTVRSDYHNPEQYKGVKARLEKLAENIRSHQHLVLQDIEMDEGYTADVYLVFEKEKPSWINTPREVSTQNREVMKLIDHVDIGKESYDPASTHFITKKSLYTLLNPEDQPVIHFKDRSLSRKPQHWNVSVFDVNGKPTVRFRVGVENAHTWESLLDRLEGVKDQVEAGSLINISAWDMYPLPVEGLADTITFSSDDNLIQHIGVVKTDVNKLLRDTVYTFNPTLEREEVRIIEHTKLGPRHLLFPNQLFRFRIVPEYDPRLTLESTGRDDFTFRWGELKATYANHSAVSFETDEGKVIRHADAPVRVNTHMFTKEEVLDFLAEKPVLSKGDEALERINLTLNFNGKSVLVKNGELPEFMWKKLQAELKPGDRITLTSFQAWTDAPRSMVMSGDIFKTLPKYEFNAEYLKLVSDEPGFSLKNSLLKFVVKPEDLKQYKEDLSHISGIWFQYGDISLLNASFEIEIRKPDPKPPLRKTKPSASLASRMKMQVLPNPASTSARAVIYLPKGGSGKLFLTNMEGKQTMLDDLQLDKGETTISLNGKLPDTPGVYVYTLDMGYGKVSVRVVVE